MFNKPNYQAKHRVYSPTRDIFYWPQFWHWLQRIKNFSTAVSEPVSSEPLTTKPNSPQIRAQMARGCGYHFCLMLACPEFNSASWGWLTWQDFRYLNPRCPPMCFYLVVVVGLVCPNDTESYVGGSVATGRASQAETGRRVGARPNETHASAQAIGGCSTRALGSCGLTTRTS
jgi:hypothetical protein